MWHSLWFSRLFLPSALTLIVGVQTCQGQCFEQMLAGSPSDPDDNFGSSISLTSDGATIFVSAPNADVSCPFCSDGEVRIFEKSSREWTQAAVLHSPDMPSGSADDVFGGSVACSANGATLLVGAPGDDPLGSSSGSVSVFQKSGSTWVHVIKLVSPDGTPSDEFGSYVALSDDGNIAVISAPRAPTGGAIYVFSRSDAESPWQFDTKLFDKGTTGSHFLGRGLVVSANANTIAAACQTANNSPQSVYIFAKESQEWIQQHQFIAPKDAYNFGEGLAISDSGDLVIVGSSSEGSAHVFERLDGAWVETDQLFVAGQGIHPNKNITLAGDGSLCVVGARTATPRLNQQGAAVVFQKLVSGWQHKTTIFAPEPVAFHGFGARSALSSDGSSLLISALETENSNETLSHVYVHSISLQDADDDTIPDECDNCPKHANIAQEDCDDNQVGDACTIANGFDNDCNLNGVPDACDFKVESVVSYAVDDGFPETTIGLFTPASWTWMNQFTVIPGGERISGIDVVWGSMPEGASATICIWSDPNNDANPSDAVLLRSINTAVQKPLTLEAHLISIPETYVGPAGTTFFAGVHVGLLPSTSPAMVDQTPPAQLKSWFVAGEQFQSFTNPPKLLQSPGVAGNFLVRARINVHPDCDGNQMLDSCEIVNQAGFDLNSNGILDECECIADIAPFQPGALGDGTVDVDDLLTVINQWGGCAASCPPSCLGDIAPPGGDCTVDVDDLLLVILSWGNCAQ